MKIDKSMEKSLIFKKQILNGTVVYQSEFPYFLRAAKQGKILNYLNCCLKLTITIDLNDLLTISQ